MRTAQELSSARQRLRLTLVDIARNTSIHPEYLAAIEDANPAELPPPELLEWILPIYAAELRLDGADLTRRYLAELRDVADVNRSGTPPDPRAPQVVTITSELKDFQPEARTGELELNAATTFKDALADDLPLHATALDNWAAASGGRRDDSVARPTRHASTPIAVIVGLVTGFLLGAAFLRGTPGGPSLTAERRAPAETRPAEPSSRDSLDSTEPTDTVDLSGSWVVTNRVESTNYRAFRNLSIGYQLRFTQDGHRIVGEGQKWAENGKLLPGSRRTPIALEGTLTGGRLDLRFTESGARRTSGGVFVMHIVDERTLRGSFASDAANSRGHSVAVRDTARSQ